MAKHKYVTSRSNQIHWRMILALGPRFGPIVIPQGHLQWLPGANLGRLFKFFKILGETGDKYNSISMPNYCDETYSNLGTYVHKVLSAGGTVATIPWSPMAPITAPGGRDLGDFEFLGGLVISNSYQVKAFTLVKSHRYLGVYPSKVFSAWTEVSTTPCPPMAPIMAPGGRDLVDF